MRDHLPYGQAFFLFFFLEAAFCKPYGPVGEGTIVSGHRGPEDFN
jgi:hypothetical protein